MFITKSKSYLLSGELMTNLTGRYVEIGLFTLSFSEYLEMRAHLGKSQAPRPSSSATSCATAASPRPWSSTTPRPKHATSSSS